MSWISVDEQMPETQHRMLVSWKNTYGKIRITCAEYIAPKSVLAEDFLDPEFSEDFAEYDEIKDCYWTPDGFYESNYESDVNYLITDEVTHWMPLPKAIETAADKGILTEEELKERNRKLVHENDELLALLKKSGDFIDAIMSFYGQNLMVMGWHQNGDGEPFDNFIDSNLDETLLDELNSALEELKHE